MKPIYLLMVSAMLSACDSTEYDYVTTAEPVKTNLVTRIGMCTPQHVAWDRTVPSKCTVLLDDGTIMVLQAPVMEGMRVITCPDKTNNIDNRRCVYWYGARPRVAIEKF